jgi:hypothetical protein
MLVQLAAMAQIVASNVNVKTAESVHMKTDNVFVHLDGQVPSVMCLVLMAPMDQTAVIHVSVEIAESAEKTMVIVYVMLDGRVLDAKMVNLI